MMRFTDDELARMVGQNIEDEHTRQAIADAARRVAERRPDLSDADAGFISDVKAEAQREGRLVFQRRDMRWCQVCNKQPDPPYVPYKSGPRRGQPNYDKPRVLHGIELADRFVRIQHHVTLGCCEECWERLGDEARASLVGVDAELPNALYTTGPRYQKYPKRHCTVCDWEGDESQMGRQRTLLGDGPYPAVCPSCGHVDTFGVHKIETIDGFAIKTRSE